MPALVTVIVNLRYQQRGIEHSINANDKVHYCHALFAGGIWGGVPREVAYWVYGLAKEDCGVLQSLKSWREQKPMFASVCPRAETLCFSCHWTAELRLLGLRFQDLYEVHKSSAMAEEFYYHLPWLWGFSELDWAQLLLPQALQLLNAPAWYFSAFIIT